MMNGDVKHASQIITNNIGYQLLFSLSLSRSERFFHVFASYFLSLLTYLLTYLHSAFTHSCRPTNV